MAIKMYAFYIASPTLFYKPNFFGIVVANIMTFSSQAMI